MAKVAGRKRPTVPGTSVCTDDRRRALDGREPRDKSRKSRLAIGCLRPRTSSPTTDQQEASAVCGQRKVVGGRLRGGSPSPCSRRP